MLCRALSEADAARRLRPPSPAARETSFLSASISSSVCSARSTFPNSLTFSSSSRSSEAGVYKRPWLARRASRRIAEPRDMDSRLFEIPSPPRQTLHRPTAFNLLALACNSPEQSEHVEFDRWMTQQMVGTRFPWCPSDEKLPHCSLTVEYSPALRNTPSWEADRMPGTGLPFPGEADSTATRLACQSDSLQAVSASSGAPCRRAGGRRTNPWPQIRSLPSDISRPRVRFQVTLFVYLRERLLIQ